MFVEPSIKRAIAFVDGQNLYHNVRGAFGYNYPNFDIHNLVGAVCVARSWQLDRVNFYTGVPAVSDNPLWHTFWTKKLAAMGKNPKVNIYSRPLVYRNKSVEVPGFGTHTFLAGEEKGIDVRLALDVVDAAHRSEFDVALIFSQDQDLSELATLIRKVSELQQRWIKIACAFPQSQTSTNKRGINNTDWCPIDKPMYDACIDHRDYRRT